MDTLTHWTDPTCDGDDHAPECGCCDTTECERTEPDCPDGEHDWTAEGEGGCAENPGVWSHGGTAMSVGHHCRTCGLSRTVRTFGVQRNPHQCDRVEYAPADAWCEHCQEDHGTDCLDDRECSWCTAPAIARDEDGDPACRQHVRCTRAAAAVA